MIPKSIDQFQSYSDDRRDRDSDRDRDRGGGGGGGEREKEEKRRGLSDSQRDRFEDMLRNLYPDRNPVAEAMVSFF